MTPHLAHIFRHPIKGHGREELEKVVLIQGSALPFDRHWAVAHEAAKLDPGGGWSGCQNFARGAKAPRLMAMEARLDEASRCVTLTHPDLPEITLHPDDPDDLAAFLAWLGPLVPQDRARPARIVTADVALTDTAFPSVSILSLTSQKVLSQRMGQALSVHRWRGNLWIEGLAPWEEFDLIGKEIMIGGVRLKIEERITRCHATMANPATGQIDANTLDALETGYGHQDFGVYARVITNGEIMTGDEVVL